MTPVQCRAEAIECARLAAEASSTPVKSILRQLARSWAAVADQKDQLAEEREWKWAYQMSLQ